MLYIKQKAFPPSGWTRSGVLPGFTLVELIVVVTILAILATIGFVSYSSYLTGVRDTNRLAQLVAIHDGMELYRTKNDLPLPDENISIMASGAIIAYQGYAGSNTLETIDFTKGGKDPKDGDYFSYYLTQDRKYFQLLAFLEEEENLSAQNPFTPSPLRRGLGGGLANAADLSNRISTVYGKKLGILTEDGTNTPVQEVVTGQIDVGTTTSVYTAHLTDTETISGTGITLAILDQISQVGGGTAADCASLLRSNGSLKDGFYDILQNQTEVYNIYCDMTTDGGGWTALVRINPSINDYSYWRINEGTKIGDHYNYMNNAGSFTVNEIYASKGIGWDGSEYLFENVNGELYSRRGTLKDLVVKSGWTGLTANLGHWTNAYQSNKNINSTNYVYFMYTDANLNDFPFYVAGTSQNDVAFSDIPWGGRGFIDNIDTYIFVR